MNDQTDPTGSPAPVIHHDPEPAVRDLGRPPAALSQHAAAATSRDEAADEQARQHAFDSAFEWHGAELKPFSSSRSAAFSALRLAMGAPPLTMAMEDMDAFEGDACRILWFCSREPAEWSLLRASPGALQSAIDTWSDAHIPSAELLKASRLALDIYFASRRNEHEVAPATGKGHGDDLGN